VERVIGRLVTDEDFRGDFERDPVATLREVAASGAELTEIEQRALAGLDPRWAARFAEGLDPRLLKCCLRTSREIV
jgi:hypothetical protein